MTKVLRFPCYLTNYKFKVFTYLHFCFLENILGNLSFIQHHVCSRITIEGKIPISIRIYMYHSKRSMNFSSVHKPMSSIPASFMAALN